MVLKAPAPKSRNEPPPINNEIFRPPQQQPTAGSIAEAGFAIGDSIDKLRTAGIAGQFDANPVTKKMQFTAPVTIPVGSGPGGPAYKQGFVPYQFDNSKVSAIVIRIIEQMDCAFVQWPNELFSAAIRNLGEPVEPARTWTITESINMVPYAEARTGYRFSATAENRIPGWKRRSLAVESVSGMRFAAAIGQFVRRLSAKWRKFLMAKSG